MEAIVVLFVVIAAALILIAALGIRIIRPYERGLIEILGRYQRTVDSGLRWILPFVQRMSKVDMRERVIDVPPQEVITKDNVVVTVDAVIFFEATDPVKLKYNVGNFQLAVTKLAQTNLRNVVGDLDLDSALTSRELINSKLRQILDDATDKWGTRVVRVEIQRIEPPPDVTEAMHRQMKAERDRRAIVTEAEGDKRSAILRSEGLKQSQILEAEGEAEALMRVADAERYQFETVAQGEATAIELVYGAIHTGDPTPDLIAIRYLEALKSVADGNATKIFLPLDTSGLTNAMASLSEIARAGQGEPAARAVDE
ncbi:SPFH domain-containing protein [Candidatus Poriferisocius sp.]|uniref:SPFH domain-containing protein n=1 Tax=Candidatus Poriferisocius sp. TaxID=3101276 RepID=UPI003B02E8F1